MLRLVTTVSISVFLVACGTTPAPAPVDDRSSGGAVIGDRPAAPGRRSQAPGGAQVQAYELPTQVAIARPQPGRAVQVLLARADDQRRAGNYAAAAVSLERGLRIEPRNAQLWNRLAHVRAAQQRFAEVEQLAAKSNALLSGGDALSSDNWRLIADALAAQGDLKGAAKARAKASVNQ